MSFTQQHREQLDKLLDKQFTIQRTLDEIEAILQIYFSNEFSDAYQHWIPQIETALFNDTKWLPRGQFTMQDTINRLIDKSQNSNPKGVSKYI